MRSEEPFKRSNSPDDDLEVDDGLVLCSYFYTSVDIESYGELMRDRLIYKYSETEENYRPSSKWLYNKYASHCEQLRNSKSLFQHTNFCELELKAYYSKASQLSCRFKNLGYRKELSLRLFDELQVAFQSNDFDSVKGIYKTLVSVFRPEQRSTSSIDILKLKAACGDMVISINKLAAELKELRNTDGGKLLDAAGITEAQQQMFLVQQAGSLERELDALTSTVNTLVFDRSTLLNENELGCLRQIPYLGHSPENLQVAEWQLSIAWQLKEDMERRRLVAVLNQLDSEDVMEFLSRSQSIDADLIERFENLFVWNALSSNTFLTWAPELIARFHKPNARWNWGSEDMFRPISEFDSDWDVDLEADYSFESDLAGLSGNKGLPWTLELIGDYVNFWLWRALSMNSSLPWSTDFIGHFKALWHWGELSKSLALPWSPDLIKRFELHWDWEELSKNLSLPWSSELIELYQDRWDWRRLSESAFLPWSLELIQRFEERWHWGELSKNLSIPWSCDLILSYEDRWDMHSISKNSSFLWDLLLLERYRYLLDWRGLSGNASFPWSLDLIESNIDGLDWFKLSGNSNLPWSLELIQRFEEQWHWSELSNNQSLPWSLDLIERFASNWDWGKLSESPALPWSSAFIQCYRDRWDWRRLSVNQHLPWSPELMGCFWSQWHWDELSSNSSLPWSIDLIEGFEEHWDWHVLSYNQSLPWSFDLYERYSEHWNLQAVFYQHRGAITWPLLKKTEIIQIVLRHFPKIPQTIFLPSY